MAIPTATILHPEFRARRIYPPLDGYYSAARPVSIKQCHVTIGFSLWYDPNPADKICQLFRLFLRVMVMG